MARKSTPASQLEPRIYSLPDKLESHASNFAGSALSADLEKAAEEIRDLINRNTTLKLSLAAFQRANAKACAALGEV